MNTLEKYAAKRKLTQALRKQAALWPWALAAAGGYGAYKYFGGDKDGLKVNTKVLPMSEAAKKDAVLKREGKRQHLRGLAKKEGRPENYYTELNKHRAAGGSKRTFKLSKSKKQHTKGHVSIGEPTIISGDKGATGAAATPGKKFRFDKEHGAKPKRGFGPNAPTVEGFKVKMKPGRGYNWLAKEVNRRSTTGGFGALKGTTAKELKKRMGGQMLYRNKSYSFDPYQAAGGGKSAIGGGNTAKQDARAMRAGAAWRSKGRAKFLAARKAKQDVKQPVQPKPKPPSDEQVAAMNEKAKRLSRTGRHLRDLGAHASVKHKPGQEPSSLSKARTKAIENKRPPVKTGPASRRTGPLLRGTTTDAADFLATQKRFGQGQQEMHKGRHRSLDRAHGEPVPSASDRLRASAARRGAKVVRYKIVNGKKVYESRPPVVTKSTHYRGDGHRH